MEGVVRECSGSTEEYSDVEDGEDPYYPETERVHHTTTRFGRMVYTPKRLVVDPYIDDGDSSDCQSVMSIQEDGPEEEEESEGDYVEGETEEESDGSESDESEPTSPSLRGDDPDDDDDK
jgi:hypothetical protein